MQISYNMDFLIAALIFLSLIFIHFISDRKINTYRNRIFVVYMILAISDMIMDMVCSFFISLHSPVFSLPVMASTTVFYILQIIAPTCMFFYIHSLRNLSAEYMKKLHFIVLIPAGFMILMILANIFTGWLFFINDEGYYTLGPYYIIMYAYAGVLLAVMLISGYVFRRQFSRTAFMVIHEVTVVAVICMLIQVHYYSILMTGFAVGLVITIFIFTVQNPYNYTDNITGLYDLSFFRDYINHLSGRKHRYQAAGLYLGNLQEINDNLGAEAGNRLLKNIADGLKSAAVRDSVFRVEDNRFVIISDSLRRHIVICERMRKLVSKVNASESMPRKLNAVIIGISQADYFSDSEKLLSYFKYLEEKEQPSDLPDVISATDGTLSGYVKDQEIRRYLAEAVEKDLFEIRFQPVYSLDEERFVSMEVLSRLRHEKMGYISPDLFISYAEQNGLISRLGLLQIKKVCSFVKEHRTQLLGIDDIKINLSPAEILTPGNISKILTTIGSYGIDPTGFQFEITENLSTSYESSLMREVRRLNNSGIGLCMDDFGSGYANLCSVLKLPFTTIKLDKSMLDGTGSNSRIRYFYSNIVSILHEMGFRVVAEGVETEEELAFVRECGVNYVQGYYYSKPLTPEDTLLLLENEKNEGRNV